MGRGSSFSHSGTAALPSPAHKISHAAIYAHTIFSPIRRRRGGGGGLMQALMVNTSQFLVNPSILDP